jgi:hypothetical protein
MTRHEAARTALAAALILGIVACVPADGPTSPGDGPSVVAPRFAFIPSPADGRAGPINRILAVVISAADGAALATRLLDVSPSAPSWTVSVPVPVVDPDVSAVLEIFLTHVDAEGAQTLWFSGRTEPFTLRRGAVLHPELFLVLGPLANLETTSVSILHAPAALAIGEVDLLTASATTSGTLPPLVFWTSLDTAVVRVSLASATGVASGTARVVASAGAFADTAIIVVPPLDGVPPGVVSVLPAGGATGASVGTLVVATFDEPLDPESVSSTSLALRTAAGVPVAGAVTYSQSQIVFDPTAPLDTLTSYTATVAPGIRDLYGNTLTASFQWSFTTSAQRLAVASSFAPGLGVLVGIAFDPAIRDLYLYDDFATSILQYTTAGVAVPPSIPNPGTASNDYDLDFLTEPLTIGGTAVSTNALLVMNGEDTPLRRVYALDEDTGAVLASMTIPMSDPVGLSYHPGRNTFFGVDWVRDVVEELNPATGAVLASFPVAPVGAPAWDVYYGDIDVDTRSGNLILVSSAQPVIRVLSPTGVLVGDVAVGGLGVGEMSGIAWDDATATAWITSTSGGVVSLVGLDP